MPRPSDMLVLPYRPVKVALIAALAALLCVGLGFLIGWHASGTASKTEPRISSSPGDDWSKFNLSRDDDELLAPAGKDQPKVNLSRHDEELLAPAGKDQPKVTLSRDDEELLATAKRIIRAGFLDDASDNIDDIGQKIMENIDVNRIKENFRLIVSRPHIAGTDGDNHLASTMADVWTRHGIEDVKLPAYDVLLSHPDPKRPNTVGPSVNFMVQLVGGDDNDDVYYTGGHLTDFEGMHTAGWKNESYPVPYLAYSVNGTVVGEPVYANFGGGSDYDELERMNVSVAGRIVIVKHGQMMCGKKVSEAEQRGAIGVLVYSDPAEVAPNVSDVYPHSWALPETGVARTSLRSYPGDPLTPGMPSTVNAYRIPLNETDIPGIPSHSISYKDAKEILGRMGGQEANPYWFGELGITYHLGPGFSDDFKHLRVKFSVQVQTKRTVSYNVIGFIYGEVEPDRYVIIGNHRDAWVQGAVDPGSGTAVLLELTRVLGELHKQGWRPRRTLVFCSWGAEEFGLIGSTEWVEEHLLKLQERAVAYVNVDTCVIGDSFNPMMSITLKSEAIRVAKMIPDVENASRTLYDSWYGNLKEHDRLNAQGEIALPHLDLYSDFGAFLYFAGVPIMELSWQFLTGYGSPYPSYHTQYESIEYMERFIDPHYGRHVGCAQFSAMMLHSLSNSALLPFTFDELVEDMVYVIDLIHDAEAVLNRLNISLNGLDSVLSALTPAVSKWNSYVASANRKDPYVLRALNDHLMLLHKVFHVRVPTEKPDSWLYRYGYERILYETYDILQDRKMRDSETDSIRRQLAQLILIIEQFGQLLAGKPYSI